jgi:lysosomal alpha-mannosidase
MSLINDRAQGGSSLQTGIVELMINRKLSSDDGRGTNSVLNYDINLQSTHYLVFQKNDKFE